VASFEAELVAVATGLAEDDTDTAALALDDGVVEAREDTLGEFDAVMESDEAAESVGENDACAEFDGVLELTDEAEAHADTESNGDDVADPVASLDIVSSVVEEWETESDGEVVGLSVEGALCEASRDHVALSETEDDADIVALALGEEDSAGECDSEVNPEGVHRGDSDALCVREKSVDCVADTEEHLE